MSILGEAGCRLGEIVGLRLDDVDLTNEVTVGKGQQPRPVQQFANFGSLHTVRAGGKELFQQHGDFLLGSACGEGRKVSKLVNNVDLIFQKM